jgi:hypothetical protein
VRRLVPYFPLLGILLLASPAPAQACNDLDASTSQERPATSLPVAAERADAILWCERPDDPRCVPGSRGAEAPELSTRFPLRAQALELSGPAATAVRFLDDPRVGPRAGIRIRVDRPPRP